ncbi:hypothetical protein LPN04_09635 [Rugamonas sp. A1-17]|nr:hypothetical protein [Rugamonas sp. A1-17]
MAERKNPFQELYVTEAFIDGGGQAFVRGFSPIIVDHALGLFQPGNVILKGLPGSGKSMLLNLLRPDTRIAYKRANVPFPVPNDFSSFIGAGINLNRSGADTFGQRPFDKDPEINLALTPLYFADFINCWIVHDIFSSVRIFQKSGGKELCDEIGISMDEALINAAASRLAQDICWFGYFDDTVTTLDDFLNRLAHRITAYRSFGQRNIDSIPWEISRTKTDTGIPITKAVQHLRDTGMIAPHVQVYVRIDQYEELAWLDEIKSYGSIFQQVIHKFLGLRDSRVSYRIGTRKFAWAPDPRMYGTAARIENERTHKEIDLDEVLHRHENRRTWTFPSIAIDIFKRRMESAGYVSKTTSSTLLRAVFGRSLAPSEEVGEYVKTKSPPDRLIRFEKEWPTSWNDYLREIAQTDLLSAILGSAWARQKGKGNIVSSRSFPEVPLWQTKIWWKKERYPIALMQIASRNQQQLQWSGEEEILALSGGNILAFLSLSQHIWDAWLRDMHNQPVEDLVVPEISRSVQSIGIQEASQEWFEKIGNAEHGDYRRQRFIRLLGEIFYKNLLDDTAMSNPGHNGFSLRISELEKKENINSFLKTLVDFGDLVGMKHTSKTKGEKRWKWYLNPILSPYFNIFHVHTKEPVYLSVDKVEEWMNRASGSYNASQP